MSVTKQKITITIDCDIYEAAKSKYSNISGRINELLSMDLYGNDEKDELIERLHNLKIEEKSITKRLCELEKQEVKIQEEESNKEKVLEWVTSVYQRNGVVGLNKLEAECKRYHVNLDEIVSLMDKSGVVYVNYA
jgi:septal ring factor EnvC (AmiA/AmiB activator)